MTYCYIKFVRIYISWNAHYLFFFFFFFFNVLFHTVLCSLWTHRHYASFCLPLTAANMEVVMVNWRKHQFKHVLYLAKCFLCFPQFFHCFFMAFIFGNGTSRVSLIVLRFGVTSCTIHAKCMNTIMFHHQEWSTTKQKQACKTMPKQLQLNAILENRQNTCVYTEVSLFAKKKKRKNPQCNCWNPAVPLIYRADTQQLGRIEWVLTSLRKVFAAHGMTTHSSKMNWSIAIHICLVKLSTKSTHTDQAFQVASLGSKVSSMVLPHVQHIDIGTLDQNGLDHLCTSTVAGSHESCSATFLQENKSGSVFSEHVNILPKEKYCNRGL